MHLGSIQLSSLIIQEPFLGVLSFVSFQKHSTFGVSAQLAAIGVELM